MTAASGRVEEIQRLAFGPWEEDDEKGSGQVLVSLFIPAESHTDPLFLYILHFYHFFPMVFLGSYTGKTWRGCQFSRNHKRTSHMTQPTPRSYLERVNAG